MRKIALVLILLSSLPAWAAEIGPIVWDATVAELPATCTPSRPYFIKDGATATDCSVGAGTHIHLCVCQADGTSYAPDSGIAVAVRMQITQATHGFSSGQWIMHDDATDAWELLDSTAVDGNNNAIGFVFSVEDANNFTLSVGGPEEWSHAFDVGPLYASSTPGTLTDTAPALGAIEWLIAVAPSGGTVIIVQREWTQL
jgi:hypothetical protein